MLAQDSRGLLGGLVQVVPACHHPSHDDVLPPLIQTVVAEGRDAFGIHTTKRIASQCTQFLANFLIFVVISGVMS